MSCHVLQPTIFAVFWALVASTSFADVEETRKFSLPDSPYVVYRGKTQLPAEGAWRVRSPQDAQTRRVYLVPSDNARRTQLGVRMTAALREQRLSQGRWKVNSVYHPFLAYAKDNDGVGPRSIDDLDKSRYEYLQQNLQTSPWYRDKLLEDIDQIEGPFVYFVPGVRFRFDNLERGTVPADQRDVMAVELRPYVDDGKHWVLHTNGACVRQEIDPAFVRQHALNIRPVVKNGDGGKKSAPSNFSYLVVAVRQAGEKPFKINVFNPITGAEKSLAWSPAGAKADKSVSETLKQARDRDWRPYLLTGPSPVLKTWSSDFGRPRAGNRRQQNRSQLSMFSLLGGRAAVEETLQLQDLNPAESKSAATIGVHTIKGVQVKGHPYEQMLAGQPGGELALANVIPDDRFMVYVAKPESILPFFDHGAGFLASLGAGFTGNQLNYDLSRKYLDRMGVNRQWLDNVLRSGLVKEMAVVLPDLFLIDGTDVTVVSRLDRPALLGGLLRLLGIQDLTNTGVFKKETPDGRPSYWAMRDDLLIISTHEMELNRVLELAEHEGQGSLGQSAEFRYMLTQLPLKAETRMFAYFSDPFIRRLVGPQVKLAQLRRLKARAAMEAMTSRALLARLNGVDADSVDDLVRMDYLPDRFPRDEFWQDELGLAHSKSHGPLPRMKTLPEVPIEQVTPEEAEAYRQYVENYSQFWRQFFDPIAVRLDDKSDGEMELTTFILPLINSSIYDQLRGLVLDHGDGRSLLVPQLEPTPVVQMSVNLKEEAWRRIANDFSGMFRRFGGVSPALLDDLGPGFHFAVFDADPVIALGSGDVMGAFGGNLMRAGRNQMFMIPVALSMLTRPSSVYIETGNAERTAQYLRQAASGWSTMPGFADNDFRVSFYQVGERDSWVWSMEVLGVIKLRFGVEVSDRYLVIRNIPWSSQDRIVQVEDSPLNGAMLTASPSACKLQLPGLFASAADQERRAVLGGLGRLYPFVLSNGGDVPAAADQHDQLFGFRPVHPHGGEFLWKDMKMESSVYGSIDRQRQPGFDASRPFGIMHAVDSVRLSMQFEDSGLRSKITWRLRAQAE